MCCKPGDDWPDWQGQTAIIVATGPSANAECMSTARDRARVIVIKESWRLAPWADVLYGSDRGWWVANKGVPGFTNFKASPSPSVCKIYPDVRLVKLVAREQILTETVGRIGCGLRTGGGHSGFHALNLAVQFGARHIVLVGFDMRLDRGDNWHEPADGTAERKDERQMMQCRVALDGCAAQLAALGVAVVNASIGSALQGFPKVSFARAMAG